MGFIRDLGRFAVLRFRRIASRARAALLPWFIQKPAPKHSQRKKEIIGLIANTVLTLVLAVTPIPVIPRWMLWFGCWVGFVFILASLPKVENFPMRTRVALSMIVVALWSVALLPHAKSQWREEMAGKTQGRLLPLAGDLLDTRVLVQVGDSTSTLDYRNPEPQKRPILGQGDTSFYVWKVNGAYHITTKIRDSEGKMVVEIGDNKWETTSDRSPALWDKNYDDHALEVLDGKGRVIFQVQMLRDRVRVQGIWQSGDGEAEEIYSPGPGANGRVEIMRNERLTYDLRPIFKYPSREHWGELISAQ